ncbi:MAG: hypothetical protein QOJ85_409 [Solirubrobacteraceae bacterium]|nr:hypothetical protein [Solirubrobacteraceae bacterium]
MILQTAEIHVEIVPDAGGKLAALRHRPSGREWLLAPPGGRPAPAPYGSSFTDAPLWGWDEMLPTIEACWDLPDHGEVWALPWTGEWRDGGLRCAVEGRARPYRLVRDVAVAGATVTLAYELSATETMPVLWAAHPQFVLDATAVVLPDGELMDVADGSRVAGAELLDPLRVVGAGAGRKLYADPEARVGSVALVDRAGPSLRLTWDPRQLPYLGIWVDRGVFAPRPVVVIEPASAYYDSLERAVGLGRAAQVAPGRPLRWHLTVEVGP